jgi:hypothetical protein
MICAEFIHPPRGITRISQPIECFIVEDLLKTYYGR